MITFDIKQAAVFLGAHKETIRKLAAGGQLPGVKIGRSWRFVEEDLVEYMRSKYVWAHIPKEAVNRSKEQWRFIKEKTFGGLASPTMDKEYKEALGLR
ncbi:helix-turn-helix domain-containing protein [Flavobacterium sp.]|uniref:helix-turn-helix domain-containing protein n=1 Tax=Flavobacterium sp. TaxID=239 RepID=UPI0025C4717C|nr:helix-turn-helix domain-containing protein [Flavobacterium sp.]MBA4155749.1 DNA-binding protein [Flavobacterium sp.]